MEELLMFLARGLVKNKDSVKVKIDTPLLDGTVNYKVCVESQDIGRLIGRKGRIIQAIRQVVRASDMKKGTKSLVQVEENDDGKAEDQDEGKNYTE
ncbi:MAG: KH domain-containing protein [Oscillospiraceae bacterium]|jgi:predicted RNA-binding protein YlqC (UPF0109 family)|nr:KH domain-containing protein [Oscillospiraceae bacterium]